MNTFENTTQNQESPNEQTVIETTQLMREIDELQFEAEKTLDITTDYLDNQETPLTEQKVGLMRSIGEKFKKSTLLKAAALGVTFMSAQPAFAENGSARLQVDNPHQINVDSSNFNNPGKIRLQSINQLRTPGLRPGQLSPNNQNALSGHLNNFQKNTLPNATINGGPAYEIAPGVYGDENTIYRQTSDGGTISVGGISIE